MIASRLSSTTRARVQPFLRSYYLRCSTERRVIAYDSSFQLHWNRDCRQQCLFSTKSFIPQNHDLRDEIPPEDNNHDPSRSPVRAYLHLKWYELIRAGLSFALCQSSWLVRNAQMLLDTSQRVLGKRVTEGLLEATFYGHFCAGPDEQRILPTLKRLQQHGIGTMLDFAAEQESSSSLDTADLSAFEMICDQRVQDFINSIRTVSVLGPDYSSVAIHSTSLTNPILLEKMTSFLEQWKLIFSTLGGRESLTAQQTHTLLASIYPKDVPKQSKILEQLKQWVDPRTGKVDLISWMSLVKEPRDLLVLRPNGDNYNTSFPVFSEQEVDLLNAFYRRAQAISQQAVAYQCRLFFDAEQVRYQLAIDHLVQHLQRQYNTFEKPIVVGTIQCYRKDSATRLQYEVEKAQRFQYSFGVKIVRGAYMESERAWAQQQGISSPIHNTIQDTHDCFNKNVQFLMQQAASNGKNPKIEICLATHNEQSINLALATMKKHGLEENQVVSFGQLYGMSDHLTFALAQQGHSVFKYVPYGQVQVLIPYLLRRAQENNSIVAGAQQELRRIARELKTRVFGW